MSNSCSRREFLRLAGVGAAGFALASCIPEIAGADRKPNIIVIVADDLGYGELSVQGCKDIRTPNIDSIAKNGIRFTDGYVSCPVCSPTRAGLNTGRYQQRFGHELNPGPPGSASAAFGLPLSETLLPARLKAAGYVTGMVGKWHLGYTDKYLPTDRGFDEFFGFLGGAHPYFGGGIEGPNAIMRGKTPVEEKEYLTDAFARESVSFIEKHKDEPFYLYLAFNAVHAPLQASDKYLKRFANIKDEKRRTFAAMTAAMDDAVGRVLRTLRKHSLEEDTLIFFVSDNGGPTRSTTSGNGPLRGYKGDVYEGGIRVPFFVQWKGHLPAGKIYNKPVISLDIAPTVLAAAGISAKDAKFDGVDLLPFLKGSSQTPHSVLYWRYGEKYAVRKGDWKLVKNGESVELYNLADDIGEKNDLSAKNPEKMKELSDLYAKWNAQLAPPLWKRQAPAKDQKSGRQRKNAGRATKRQRKETTQ